MDGYGFMIVAAGLLLVTLYLIALAAGVALCVGSALYGVHGSSERSDDDATGRREPRNRAARRRTLRAVK